jgi:hypothetical protein
VIEHSLGIINDFNETAIFFSDNVREYEHQHKPEILLIIINDKLLAINNDN